MEKLSIVRHGDYDDEGNLTVCGKEQMVALGELMMKCESWGEAIILSSVAPRALQSARILAEILNTFSVEEHAVLWSDKKHKVNLKLVTDLIHRRSDFDNIIIVTHLEYAHLLPLYLFRRLLGVKSFNSHEISKGDAWMLDWQKKTAEHIHP